MHMRSLNWILSVGLLAAGPAAATEIEKDFHERFDVREGATLRLLHGEGEVSVEPWDESALDVTVRYRADFTKIGIGGTPDFDVEFRQDGGTVHVIGKETGGSMIGFRSTTRYEYLYTVRAPAWLRLDLEGEDGNVRIRDWKAEVSARIEDGDVRIEGLQGNLDVEAEDGNVEVSRCRVGRARILVEDGRVRVADCEGAFDVRSEDGSVSLERVVAGEVAVRTEDGDVSLDLRKGSRPDVNVRAEDGSVRVTVERGVSAEFSIATDDGSIRVDLPGAERVRTGEHEASGAIGGGGGRIRISTKGGSVSLREAGAPAK